MSDHRFAIWLTGVTLVWCAGIIWLPYPTLMLTLLVIVYGLMRGAISLTRQIKRDVSRPVRGEVIGRYPRLHD